MCMSNNNSANQNKDSNWKQIATKNSNVKHSKAKPRKPNQSAYKNAKQTTAQQDNPSRVKQAKALETSK